MINYVGLIGLVKSKYKCGKTKCGQNMIFIEVQPRLLPLLTGAFRRWNFKSFSFIRLVNYTNGFLIVQPTS